MFLPFSAASQEQDSLPVLPEEEKTAIAYGETDKIASSSAISSIDAETIRKNAVTNLEETLNGTLSGLYSIKNGGQKFGARNYEFYVRGQATTGFSTPLILVDDVEANISMLDFNEVESVQVLKDASALAIYGMRGANGVILIKTKRGTSDKKNTISLDFRVGMQTPVQWGKRLNAYDYTTLYNEALINDGGTAIYQPGIYLNNPDPYLYPDEDYSDPFTKNQSLSQQYNFSARGGNETAQYFCLVGYTKQSGHFDLPDGVGKLRQKSYERFNFRSNIDVDLGAGFEMSVDVQAAFDYNRSPWIDSGSDSNASSDKLVELIMNTSAIAFPVTNKDGSLGGTSVYTVNPQGILKSGLRTDEHKLLTANARLSKDLSFITPGLGVFARYHFENYNTSYKGKYKQYAVYQYTGQDPVTNEDSYSKYGVDDTKKYNSRRTNSQLLPS